MKLFKMIHIPFSVLLFFAMTLGIEGCKKLVEIPDPSNTVTAHKTFSNDQNAVAAISAIYNDISRPPIFRYGNGLTTIAAGGYADELVIAATYIPFYTNTLLSDNSVLYNSIWAPAYNHIYQANAIIEGLESSTGVSQAVKNQLIGEAKFFRAFAHFYLVNLFGDVPLVTQSAWAKINLIARTPSAEVYSQIIQDLKDAEGLLSEGYPGTGEKIRVNKFAAAGLLARVYLYKGDWANAEEQSNLVINSGQYNIVTDLNAVFLKNSDEAMLQWQIADVPQTKWATLEGRNFIPVNQISSIPFYLTPSLMSAFESSDLRRKNWVDSTKFSGKVYYYPFKYQVRAGSAGNVPEYYMVLRYAEQFLIRAEARANLNTNLAGAISDLNILRQRAGLAPINSSLNQSAVLAAIAQERRIELFAEWGHRWFDLKRTGQADAVLGSKPNWNPQKKLWPIPSAEITLDPNLTQNPGY